MEELQNTPQKDRNQTVVIIRNQKSIGLSILLTLFFGPLGMLYSTVSGGIIMLIISVVIGFLTFGFGALFTWPICIIWGAVAASRSNTQQVTITEKQ